VMLPAGDSSAVLASRIAILVSSAALRTVLRASHGCELDDAAPRSRRLDLRHRIRSPARGVRRAARRRVAGLSADSTHDRAPAGAFSVLSRSLCLVHLRSKEQERGTMGSGIRPGVANLHLPSVWDWGGGAR
jgi:hypothetical protein